MNNVAVSKLLVENKSFKAILANLIEFKKKSDESFTNQILAETIGKKSPSYISDILSGRRNIALDLLPRLCEFFELNRNKSRYLTILATLDREKKQENISLLEKELNQLRIIIGLPSKELSEELEIGLFALEVFVSFDLFKEAKPSYEQLLKYYGRDRILDLERALRYLISEKLIIRKDGFFEYIEPEFRSALFAPSTGSATEAHFNSLRYSCKHARESINKFVHDDNSAVFHTSIIRCNKKDYRSQIRNLSSKLVTVLSAYSELPLGDKLVRGNVYMYPIAKKKS